MASVKKINRLFLLIALIFLLPPCLAKTGRQFSLSKISETGQITLRFNEKLAVDSVSLPIKSEKLWGNDIVCRAATIKLADKNFLASAPKGELSMIFKLDGLIGHELIITPIYTMADNAVFQEARIEIDAVKASIKLIEDDIRHLSQQVIDFQKGNNCYSCHTALPLAIMLDEADKSGFRIPLQTVEEFGQSLGSLQRIDGTFHFPSQPDYGTISPTLCAGAVFSLLARFDKRLLVNLERILQKFPEWLDEKGELKSDFFFRPVFTGQTTSALFETLVVASIYYFSPSITGQPADDSLRQRLIFLNQHFALNEKSPTLQTLILLSGLPYIGQFSDEQMPGLLKQMQQFLKLDPEAARADISALTALFFYRMNFKEGLRQISANSFSAETLSEKIWVCLIKVLQNDPRP
jgi:hypothetical protein